MNKSYEVTVPADLLALVDRVAAYQGVKRGAFTCMALKRHIRGMRQNLPILTPDDIRVLNGEKS